MDEEKIKTIAQQLRQPTGAFAIEVGQTMNKGNLQMNLCTIENLVLNKNNRLLEIGMGNGFFVKNIFELEKSIHYIGCDFSEEMVEEANKLNLEYIEQGKAKFINANADKIPFDNQTFDVVFTINTIYFWEDIKVVLTEIKRVLKREGQFVIAIRPKSIMDDFPISKYGFNTFSKTDISQILESNGFDVVEIIEKEEEPLEFFGEKIKNEFMVVKTILKPNH